MDEKKTAKTKVNLGPLDGRYLEALQNYMVNHDETSYRGALRHLIRQTPEFAALKEKSNTG